ncbi:hypothetical protein AAC387_Pa06g2042 [Persea americana]
MQLTRVDPDYVTIVAVLTACANLGALRKGSGCTAISHDFVDRERTHTQSDDINEMLDQLSLELKQYGYVPETVVRASSEYQ